MTATKQIVLIAYTHRKALNGVNGFLNGMIADAKVSCECVACSLVEEVIGWERFDKIIGGEDEDNKSSTT